MNLRALRTGALALIIATTLGLAPSVSQASVLADLSIEDRTDGAVYIVEGKVVSTWTELDARGRIWSRAKVDVTAQHKGDDLPSEIVIDSMGGTYGDYTLTVVGQAVYSEGENVFLFLDKLERSGRLVPLGKFLGKYTLRRAPGDTESHAFNWHASANSKYDHRFLPHKLAENRLYVGELRQVVAQRLETGWDGKEIPGLSTEQLKTRNTPVLRRVQ